MRVIHVTIIYSGAIAFDTNGTLQKFEPCFRSLATSTDKLEMFHNVHLSMYVYSAFPIDDVSLSPYENPDYDI